MPIDINTLPDEDPTAPPLPDFNNLPPQGGGGQEAVQPGVYRFRAPRPPWSSSRSIRTSSPPTGALG